MKTKRKAKFKEIKVWYKLKLKLKAWTTKTSGKTYIIKLPDETWYGGYWFNTGYFAFIQCGKFAVHIRFTWWWLNF